MAAKGKGSLILKILIVILAVALWETITIPNKIWSEEQRMTTVGRKNMEAVYEAERFYNSHTKEYIPSDSLEKLIVFIENDSSLQQKQRIGELTNVLYNSINRILEIPALSSLVPLSQSIDEINGDLSFNTRYFKKYDNLMVQKDEISRDLIKFDISNDFPNFNKVKTYVDSLDELRDRINEESLQNSALLAQRYVDSLEYFLPRVETNAANEFWKTEYQKIFKFISDIKKTDLVKVTSVADRLKKFIDRINTSMKAFLQVDVNQNVTLLSHQKNALGGIYNDFITHDNFLLTQQNGILQLSEVDSILVTFNENNFTCPDTFDGVQRYIVSYQPNQSSLVVECPNLLNTLQNQLVQATTPLSNITSLGYMDKIQFVLDSTIAVMNYAKNRYRLARADRTGEIILNMKEVIAEMQSLDNVFFYRYNTRVSSFIDTVKSEKKLSVLKPMIEDILNPMDTLATRIETGNIADLEERLNYFGKKIQELDSLIQIRVKRRNVPPFYPIYEKVFEVVREMKTTFNPEDARQLRAAKTTIENALLEALEGYKERVYGVFIKKHINHGYISGGTKSWESE